MAELLSKTLCEGLLPLEIGDLRLSEVVPGQITSIAPFLGQAKALSAALKDAHGMAWPAAGRSTGRDGARCIWTGKDQSMLIGPVPNTGLARFAAFTDQSDAWAVVRIEGPLVEAVLARLMPIDLRAGVFKRGHAAQTLLQHMTVSVTRISENAFQIMAFRSMAGTLVHDLSTAMLAVAARGDIAKATA